MCVGGGGEKNSSQKNRQTYILMGHDQTVGIFMLYTGIC